MANPFQFASGIVTGSSSSRSVNVTTATAAGDTLLVVVVVNNTTCTVSSVTDGAGNVYTLDRSFTSAFPMVYAFRSPGATGGSGGGPTGALTTSNAVQVTTAASTGNVEIYCTDAPGVGEVDQIATIATGTSTTPSISATPTVDNEVCVSYFGTANGGGSPTINSPFTSLGTPLSSGSNPYTAMAYDVLTGGSGVAQTSTLSITSANWRAGMWTFKPGGITVTATWSGGTAPTATLLKVYVLTGGTEAGGNNAKNTSGFNGNLSFTPTFSNSRLVWCDYDFFGGTAFSTLANNNLTDNFLSTHGERFADGYYTGTVTASTPVTVGATSGDGGTSCVGAAYEIQPSGGTTPPVDAHTPAAATSTSGGALTTASFAPPTGAVVVAVIIANNNAASVAVTDSSSMTWTRRDTAGGANIGIFTATVGGGGTPGNVNLTTPNLALAAPALTPAGATAGNVNLTTPNLALAAPALTPSGGGTPANVNLTTPNLALSAPALTPAGAASANVNLTTPNLALAAPALTPAGATGTITQVAAWTNWDINNYGLCVTPVANHPGNAMVAYIAWNPAYGINPIANVADDAHNYWQHLGTSSVNGNVRCSIWMTTNCRKGPVSSTNTNGGSTVVSVSLSQWTSGLSVTVAELSGCPTYIQLDGTPLTTFNNSTTSVSLSGTAHGADLVLGMAVNGNISQSLSHTSSYNALPKADATQTFGNGTTTIYPEWKQVTSGSIGDTWSVGSAAPLAALMVAVTLSPTAPAQPNANWPSFSIQAAFGYNPGDPTAVPTWTDITARALQPDGSTIVNASRGRSYELATPEAGTITVQLDNHDGAFTPGNSSSPYYPNIMLQTPVRILATWNGVTYPVGAGYISAFPQQWPDPQYGFSPATAVDGMGVLAQINMYSAYQSEVLLDSPYAYFPLSEQYQEANGLPFNNLAFGNNRPAIGMDDTRHNIPISTGQTFGLFGDAGSGVGQTISGATGGFAGLQYTDPNLPQVAASNGITLECWAIVVPGTATNSVTLLQLFSQPPNYPPGGVSANLPEYCATINAPISPATAATIAEMATTQLPGTTFSGATADANAHHHCIVIAPAASNKYQVKYYFDGALLNTWTTANGSTNIISDLVIGPLPLNGGIGPFGNFAGGVYSGAAGSYSIAHVAYYAGQLDPSRIAKHYHTGVLGANGDSGMRRFTKILTWSKACLPKAAGPADPNPQMGYADAYAGSSVMAALGTVSSATGCLTYSDGFGNTTYLSRQQMYNLSPKYTFDDSGAANTAPYLPTAGFGYDVTYLYNQVAVQRQISQTNAMLSAAQGIAPFTYSTYGAAVNEADSTSETEYLPRNALSTTIETTSDQDAYDWANWNLTKYKQPAFRVKTITLDPASNPSIWPIALGVEQGDLVQINRHPVGGPAYSVLGMVQKVTHNIGPNLWQVQLTISPYTIEANVLQLGVSGFNSVTTNRIGW